MANRRKLENGAFALLVFGALLMVPPILSIFNVPLRFGGVPVIVIYLFSVWIALIIATRLMSRRMKDDLPKRIPDELPHEGDR